MVLSYYLFKPFYSAIWHILNLIKKRRETVFYCHTPVDLENWLPVQRHLKTLRIVTDKGKCYKELKERGIAISRLPVFPKAVIMCRVAAHKFPSRRVIKIGMTHGAYHFKRMSSAKNYRPFSLYLFTSQRDLENAQARGIRCGKVGGFPKLDPYLNQEKPTQSGAKTAKPRIMFTATYDSSGMSGIALWFDQLARLHDRYEIYISVHPWTNPRYQDQLKALPDIHFISGSPLPLIPDMDVCIVDTSSIIAECTALNKALISWILPDTERSVPEVKQILEDISIRISSFAELEPAIQAALADPQKYEQARFRANAIFFDRLDGKAGLRTADAIIKLLPELKP